MTDRVLAVVVCFNPNISALSVALKAVAGQVEKTLVVDNASSNRHEIIELLEDLSEIGQVSLIPQRKNIGLGSAHNVGIRFANEHGFSHVLLLDQDSVPLAGMVSALQSASAAKRESKTPLSAVGATYLNADNGSESFFVRFGRLKFRRQYCGQRDADGCLKADFLISSGCLISMRAIKEIGEMDEGLFIDHVDTEWFLRARSKGFQAFGVCDAVMQHGLGEQTHRISVRGLRSIRQRNVPQHKPFRYYYIFRNSVALYRRAYASPMWKWNDFQRLVLIAIMFGIFKAPRLNNFKMMVAGTVDGLRGITGQKEFP
jgi:rhamnosyltransferase